jgi:hypothetical protein
MIKTTHIIYVLLTLISIKLSSQSSINAATQNSIDNEGPSVFIQGQTEKSNKKSELISAEEANKVLFNISEINSVYRELIGIQNFYNSHNAKDLWPFALKQLFSDRQDPIRDNCVPILELYPNGIEPIAAPKFHPRKAINDVMGEALFDEFSFCLAYLGLTYLDKEIWDVYISKESDLIQDVNMLQASSLRLKGFILATDFMYKVCKMGQGLQVSQNNSAKP